MNSDKNITQYPNEKADLAYTENYQNRYKYKSEEL